MGPGSQVCLAAWTFLELSPRGKQAPGWTPGAQGAGREDMAPPWDRGRQCPSREAEPTDKAAAQAEVRI